MLQIFRWRRYSETFDVPGWCHNLWYFELFCYYRHQMCKNKDDFSIIPSIFVIHSQRSHIYIQPFRIICYLAFIFLIIGIVISIAKLKSSHERSLKVYHLFLEILLLAIETYVLICINSIHRGFRGERLGRSYAATC